MILSQTVWIHLKQQYRNIFSNYLTACLLNRYISRYFLVFHSMSPFVSMANTNTGATEVLTYTSSVEHYIWFLHVLWRMQKAKKWAQKKLQRLLPNSAKNNISEQAQRVSGRCSGIMVSKQDSGANRVWALVRDNVGEPNKLWQSDPWWTSILSRGSRNTPSRFMLQKLG